MICDRYMNSSDKPENKKPFVYIGDELGHTEEYLGDSSTTYTENGKIYAAIAGFLSIDEKNRQIYIEGSYTERQKTPLPGDIVMGVVYSIRKTSVGTKINTINNLVVVDMGLIGNVHVSNVSKSYVDKLDEIFEKNDIVRAKIIRQEGREFQITLVDNNLGVIKSFCKYCGHEMKRKNKTQVICPFCGNVQRKIMANDYGEFEEVLHF
ncbi:MAG: hypothetical protein DRO88_07540 [Promethearchaeia archaeon]|nr:MAG: hypothetical protein DRO88_07540 [Candidatus Lokiarchaeia archaeon]